MQAFSSDAPATPRIPPALLATIGALTFIDFLQNGMVTFAATPIMGEIGASPEEYTSVAVIYACVAVVMIALQGWLVHHLGLRRYLLASLGAAAAGAVVCAMSRGEAGFLTGRVMMAMGCAAMLTSSRLTVNLIAPGPARFHGIKALATGLCTGTALGPLLASAAVDHDGWPLMFWLVAGLSLLAMWPVARAMPGKQAGATVAGQARLVPIAALGVGSFLLLHALQRSYYDFFSDRHRLVLFALAGLLALAYFIRAETRNGAPLLKLGGMNEVRFLCGLALFMFCYLMLGANGYLVPQMLQRALGLSWANTGMFFAMGLGAGVLTFAVMAQLLPRWPSPRKFFVAGFVALAAFSVLMARLTPMADPWADVLPALACYGVFIMILMPATAMNTFTGLTHDPAVFAHAQQVKNMLAQVGQALGIMAATVGQQWLTSKHYSVLQAGVTQGNVNVEAAKAALSGVYAAVADPVQAQRMALARIAQLVDQQSALLANLDHFRALAVLAVVGVLISWTQRVFR
ncbi:multidrug efflux MFS transporter [Achromobacter sp. LC458]|uniref:MFS transporter n=1 Tax=Achromobacter sp. LC458 TaxID=1120623 RepID=UPI000629F798|nr:MFS transporter [Achromobacter sp. LC458]TRM49443.1 multidrug efflux MFS transporter [Achromobacter sp. LC458]